MTGSLPRKSDHVSVSLGDTIERTDAVFWEDLSNTTIESRMAVRYSFNVQFHPSGFDPQFGDCVRRDDRSGKNMMTRYRCLIVVVFICLLNRVQAGDSEDLDEPLRSFAPLLGKTWTGEFKNSTPEKPIVDVCVWERALNGKAIRVLHSVNDGVYGGETIIIWDANKQSLVYWYFTTAGFRTEGTMKFQDGTWTAQEAVAGTENVSTEVISKTTLLSDGRLRVVAEYIKDGKTDGGREVFYRETPTAKVSFR